MKNKWSIGRIAVLALLSTALQTAAQGASIFITPVGFASGSKTVTDPYSTGAAATTQTDVSVATPTLPQFDAATGVLTGATVILNSTRTQTISGTSTHNGNKTLTFVGNSTAKITAPGVDNTFSSVTRSQSCSGNGSCTYAANTTAPIATNLSTATTSLNSYVGTGTVGTTLTLPQLQTNMTISSSTPSAGNSTYTLQWDGTIAATYTYLLHAAPSFDAGTTLTTLALDFGSVTQNSVISPLGFSLFNPAGDRTGLNLTGITGSGDTSILTTDLSLFSNLAQGGNSDFNAFLDTSTVGSFGASYTLNLADFMPAGAASSTESSYLLELNLTGEVTAPVPIPASIWLLMSGWAGLVGVSRRRAPFRKG